MINTNGENYLARAVCMCLLVFDKAKVQLSELLNTRYESKWTSTAHHLPNMGTHVQGVS